MAKKAHVKINPAGIRALMMGAEMHDLIDERTEDLLEACLAESSWGGYANAVDDDGTRIRGRVWSYARQDGSGRTERAVRMIRNLGGTGSSLRTYTTRSGKTRLATEAQIANWTRNR